MNKKLDRNLKKWEPDSIEGNAIYRYRNINQYLFESLIKYNIWFTDPLKLNDPFECQVILPDETTDIEKGKNKYIKNIINQIGIAAFSLYNKNILMWSHYGDEHKGLCVKYNIEKEKNFFKTLKKVNYDEKYPDLSEITDGNEKIKKIILTKSKDWEYEKEVRLVKAKEQNYKYKKPEVVEAIYFGARCKEEDIETIKEINKKFYGDKIKLYKMVLKQKEFELEENEI